MATSRAPDTSTRLPQHHPSRFRWVRNCWLATAPQRRGYLALSRGRFNVVISLLGSGRANPTPQAAAAAGDATATWRAQRRTRPPEQRPTSDSCCHMSPSSSATVLLRNRGSSLTPTGASPVMTIPTGATQRPPRCCHFITPSPNLALAPRNLPLRVPWYAVSSGCRGREEGSR